jgi:hypothetical protein
MENSEITGMVALLVSVGGVILGIINHKRLRSNCCGRKMEVSVDVENTTPPNTVKLSDPPVDEAHGGATQGAESKV